MNRVGLRANQGRAAQVPGSRTRSRANPDRVSGLIPKRSRAPLPLIPTGVGIKSGSWLVSPLDFGIKKKFSILKNETGARRNANQAMHHLWVKYWRN